MPKLALRGRPSFFSAPSRPYRITLGLACGLFVLASRASAQAVIEDSSFHGRFSLGLAYGPSRTAASCLRLQNDEDFDIARDDCGYAEGVFVFAREFYRSVGNQVWSRGVVDLHLKTNMLRNYSDTQGSGDDAMVLSNRNFYVETGNFLQSGEVIWFGNRSYDYEDLWLLDLRLLDQHGPGFGIEKVPVPLGQLAAAFFRVSSRAGGPAQDTIDLRWSRVPLFEGWAKFVVMSTQTGSNDAKSGERKYEAMQGAQAALVYEWEDEDIIHKWALQYGRGLFGGYDMVEFSKARGSALNDSGEERDPAILTQNINEEERNAFKRSSSYRIADQIDYVPEGSRWSLRAAAAVEQVNFGGLRYERDGELFKRGDMRTSIYALRPAYDISDTYGIDLAFHRLVISRGIGYRHRDPESGVEQMDRQPVDRELQRLSLGFLIRPLAWGYAEFRSYVAFNKWNRQISRDITQGAFRNAASGVTGGIALNIWW